MLKYIALTIKGVQNKLSNFMKVLIIEKIVLKEDNAEKLPLFFICDFESPLKM